MSHRHDLDGINDEAVMTSPIILRGTPRELKPIIMQIMAMHQLLEGKDVGTIYACNNDTESVKRKGKPQVTLFFLEDSLRSNRKNNQASPTRRKQRAAIRFRLMNESTQSFSKANGIMLGTRIKEIFGANSGFVWNKGKTMYSYTDWEMGYQFQLLCRTETEAKRIVTAVMSIQSHTPNWSFFNTVKNDQEDITYPENPGTEVIMGETVDKPLTRPNVDVRFQYAYVSIKGLARPVTLYDRVHRRVGALVT